MFNEFYCKWLNFQQNSNKYFIQPYFASLPSSSVSRYLISGGGDDTDKRSEEDGNGTS